MACTSFTIFEAVGFPEDDLVLGPLVYTGEQSSISTAHPIETRLKYTGLSDELPGYRMYEVLHRFATPLSVEG